MLIRKWMMWMPVRDWKSSINFEITDVFNFISTTLRLKKAIKLEQLIGTSKFWLTLQNFTESVWHFEISMTAKINLKLLSSEFTYIRPIIILPSSFSFPFIRIRNNMHEVWNTVLKEQREQRWKVPVPVVTRLCGPFDHRHSRPGQNGLFVFWVCWQNHPSLLLVACWSTEQLPKLLHKKPFFWFEL